MNLGKFPIRIWDEARNAVNAFEMLYNGDYLIPRFNGDPDMWNTKPPFLIWFQVIFMKILGPTEIAIRLPSAIAGLLTCFTLVFFSEKYLKNYWFGIIAAILLVTFNGYVDGHSTRTGDYDAMLTFLLTGGALLFFLSVEDYKNKYLYLFFLFMSMAVLTKGVAALLFLPALGIYALIRRKIIFFLKNRHFYFGLLLFIFISLGYYFLREAFNPGYLEKVQFNELGGRYLETKHGHDFEFWFYLKRMVKYQLKSWFFLVPIGILIGMFSANQKLKFLTLYSTLLFSVHFIVISYAKSKFQWYNIPEFPFLAIIIAMVIFIIFENLRQQNLKAGIPKLLPYLFLVVVFWLPYKGMAKKVIESKEFRKNEVKYEIGYYLQNAVKGKEDVDGYKLLYHGYSTQNLYYLKVLQKKGVRIGFKNWKNLDPGNRVIAHQQYIKSCLEEYYDYRVIDKKGNVVKYEIYGKRNLPEN
ncbi:MAG: phospholipid carrier-dependent glycosyltransferase [Flavobacteriaceae bacterium]|nr:phospholipid carrier-dependent glycosyltransferase [Flavobacteriaceae bacterium]